MTMPNSGLQATTFAALCTCADIMFDFYRSDVFQATRRGYNAVLRDRKGTTLSDSRYPLHPCCHNVYRYVDPGKNTRLGGDHYDIGLLQSVQLANKHGGSMYSASGGSANSSLKHPEFWKGIGRQLQPSWWFYESLGYINTQRSGHAFRGQAKAMQSLLLEFNTYFTVESKPAKDEKTRSVSFYNRCARKLGLGDLPPLT